MKKRICRLCSRLIVLAVLCTFCPAALASAQGTVVYRSSAELANGLECCNEIAWHVEAGRQESWTLTYSLSSDVRPIIGWGSGIRQSDTLTTAAALVQEEGANILAGINTDFFDMQTGSPMGMIIRDGILYSSDAGRNAIGFSEDAGAVIGVPGVELSVTNLGSRTNTANVGKKLTISHYNKEPGQWVFDLISRDYAESLRLTNTWYIAEVETLSGEMALGAQVMLRVSRILTISDETYEIPEDRMILIASADGYAAGNFSALAQGDELQLDILAADGRFYAVTQACGGGDLLVSDGRITDSSEWTDSIRRRNPRTAVGIKEDGSIVFYVIDGRVSGHSGGLTLDELAQKMLELGCVTALNLDGGGSTTLACEAIGEDDISIRNQPSDGKLRKCAVFLLLAAVPKSDGQAAHLTVANAGALVLTDSCLELGEIRAADGGYVRTQVPEDTQIRIVTGPGYVEDGVYYSDAAAGGVVLQLSSEQTGAQGSAMVHVLSDVSSVALKEGNTLLLGEGDSIQLTPQAEYYGRQVAGGAQAYTYALSGEIGSVDENGLLTIDTLTEEQSGMLTVGYGTAANTAVVDIYCRFADTEGHWAEEYIRDLSAERVTIGTVSNGQRFYEPDSTITCQELCVMMARVLDLDTEATETQLPYADSGQIGSWAYGSVQALFEKGILLTQPEEDGLTRLRPTQPLSRQQVCAMTARALGLDEQQTGNDSLSGFSDSGLVSDWAYAGMRALVQHGVVAGYPDGTLRPDEPVTRAQLAKLLCSLIC